MTDSQSKTVWNDWANYVLSIIKRFDGDISKNQDKINDINIQIEKLRENKLSQKDFERFLSEDYIIFKTTVLTKAKINGAIWGVIGTLLVSLIIALIKSFLENI